MAIQFRCGCGQKLEVATHKAGQRVSCPICGERVAVPDESIREAGDTETYGLAGRDDDDFSLEEVTEPPPPAVVYSPPVGIGGDEPPGAPAGETIHRPKPRPKRQPPKSQFEAWGESFAWPMRGDGKWTVLIWTGILGGAHGLIKVFAIWLFTWMMVLSFALLAFLIPAYLIFFGYFIFYVLQILKAAANGDDELPSANRGEEIAWALWTWIVCWLVSFGLLSAYLIAAIWMQEGVNPYIAIALAAIGVFYMPGALLSAALWETPLATNPVTVLSAVIRMPSEYVCVCLITGMIVAVNVVFIIFVPEIPPLSQLVQWFIAVYGSAVVMHLLGSMYYRHRERIGWFREDEDLDESPL